MFYVSNPEKCISNKEILIEVKIWNFKSAKKSLLVRNAQILGRCLNQK